MKNKYLLIIIVLMSFPAFAQVTGLSGWSMFADPGHSQNENVGAYGYSEAPKVLRVALNLQQILMSETDIDTAYVSRTNDNQLVSLSQRTDHANTVGAAWYHSIHSDAPSTSSNSTLLLWGQNQNGTEKTPNGGKAMSSIITDILTRGYRTNTRGSWGDCSFYGTCSPGSGPYLAVNRLTTMPSELSEAGFHTNLIQNMINMNADWKRLEARTLYWSFLKYKNIARPFVGIVAGHVADMDKNLFVNGAVVSINGQTDTTDTYESVFHLYSSDPNQLRNGFFYFENIPAGTHTLTINASGFDSYSTQVTVSDTFFTFVDPKIVSNIPPVITFTSPEPNDSLYPGYDNLIIQFSRPMNVASVESNLIISPSVTGTFTWVEDDAKLVISTENFQFNTQYSVTVGGNAKDKFDHLFDGDGNGVGGDSYTLIFKTKILDIYPPFVAQNFPSGNESNVSLQPVINLAFNELLSTPTLSNKFKLFKTSDQSVVNSQLKYYTVNSRGVLSGFVKTKLLPLTNYTVQVLPGIKDVQGNEMTTNFEYTFTTGDTVSGDVFVIDNFEAGINGWLQPQQSPSTSGIISEETSASWVSNIYCAFSSGTKSMRLGYGWDTTASGWLIREYFTGPNETFNENATLRVFLFGDGRNHKFRYCINDEGPQGHEVSLWYNVDWYGWKEVNWTPSVDGLGQWIGDGVLQGNLSLDSYQFTYTPGNKNRGEYYVDDATLIKNTAVSVEEDQQMKPTQYTLDQNYPNPFNPVTNIRFGLVKSGNVKLEVYNLIGQKVASLVDGFINSGYHTVSFDASNLPSGVYIYKISTQEFVSTRKLVLLK